MAGQLLNTPGLCLWAPNSGCGFLCSLWPRRYLADCWMAYGPTQGLGLAMCPPRSSATTSLFSRLPKEPRPLLFPSKWNCSPHPAHHSPKIPLAAVYPNRRNRATLCSQLVPQRYQQHLLVPMAASVLPMAERGQE